MRGPGNQPWNSVCLHTKSKPPSPPGSNYPTSVRRPNCYSLQVNFLKEPAQNEIELGPIDVLWIPHILDLYNSVGELVIEKQVKGRREERRGGR